MSQPHDQPLADVAELLSTNRELSDAEQERLHLLGEHSWYHLYRDVSQHSRAVYSTTTAQQFAICVSEHMDTAERLEMKDAETYTCPICHELLKDRRTPVATAILLERTRMKDLWQNVVDATDEPALSVAVNRFIRALGS